MKWRVKIIGDDFDLEQLAKSFSNSNDFLITKESDGFYLHSSQFETCMSGEEVKNRAKDILSVLNGAKTLALGGNTQVEIGHVELRKPNGKRQIFVELTGKIFLRSSLTTAIKNNKGNIIKESCPADEVPEWLGLGLSDENVKKALRIYGVERHSWAGLYKVYEIIENDVGGIEVIADNGWATKSTISRFKHTANSPSAIGDQARHGKESTKPPKKPMRLSEARLLIETLLIKWLRYKSNKIS